MRKHTGWLLGGALLMAAGAKAEGWRSQAGTYAVLDTSAGEIVFRLLTDKAPETTANFIGLAEGTKEFTDPLTNKKAKRPYYEGVIFHRVIDGFMIQGGDPTGTGRGGPGYEFPDEIDPKQEFDKKGQVAMANRGPDTNGSQFFITLGAVGLPKSYTIFGQVVAGQSVVDGIGKQPTSGPPNDRPLQPPVIRHAKIVRVGKS